MAGPREMGNPAYGLSEGSLERACGGGRRGAREGTRSWWNVQAVTAVRPEAPTLSKILLT